MFTHRIITGNFQFVQLTTECGSMLRLTAGHYLFASNGFVTADSVRRGDVLLGADASL